MYERAPTWMSVVVLVIVIAVLGWMAWVVFVGIPEQQAIIDKNEQIIRELNQ